MLAYAANRPTAGKRQSSPNALLVIVTIHVALLAAVMSAKMDLPSRFPDRRTIVDLIPNIAPPPLTKPAVQPKVPQMSPKVHVDSPRPLVQTPTLTAAPAETTTPIDFDTLLGTSEGSAKSVEPVRVANLTRREARLLTPPSELKPPYPSSKLASEEEGVLTLRLSIDQRGRVVAVDAVGPADPAFLASARHYLIAHWRYQPAMEGEQAVASSVTIVLHFKLDG